MIVLTVQPISTEPPSFRLVFIFYFHYITIISFLCIFVIGFPLFCIKSFYSIFRKINKDCKADHSPLYSLYFNFFIFRNFRLVLCALPNTCTRFRNFRYAERKARYRYKSAAARRSPLAPNRRLLQKTPAQIQDYPPNTSPRP